MYTYWKISTGVMHTKLEMLSILTNQANMAGMSDCTLSNSAGAPDSDDYKQLRDSTENKWIRHLKIQDQGRVS